MRLKTPDTVSGKNKREKKKTVRGKRRIQDEKWRTIIVIIKINKITY